MRRYLLPLTLVVSAACGGGADPVAPPPPPPPSSGNQQPGPPASVAIQAGDGQSAAPTGTVPVRPSVVVRDASSRPVPSVSVTFAVDTGGGSITGASAVTGNDGVATAGDWTLGPAEGVNRLRVTSGSLPPVVFTAQATFPTILLADVTIGPSGGTILYTKAGDPLDGTKLVIPPGAFPAPGHWRVEARPAATGPKLVAGRIAAPILHITTDQGLSDSALYLTMPVNIPADSFPTVFIRDPVSGRMEAFTPVAFTATSLTVATRHFSASRLFGPAAPAAANAALPGTPQFTNILMILGANTGLGSGVGTAFLPGNDDWEFPNYGTYITPFGNRVGTSLSALYYFQTNNFQIQPVGLWGKYDLGAFWADDPQGVRVSAVAESAIDWTAATKVAIAINSQALAAFGSIDAAHLYTIGAAMLYTGQPQLLVGFGGAAQGMYALIAYHADLNGITAVDPNNPGVPMHIPFVNGRFLPVNLGPVAGAPSSQFFMAQTMGASSVIDASALAALFAQAAAGTAGAAEFPQYKLQYLDDETVLWRDLPSGTLQVTSQELQLRSICPTCARAIANGAVSGLQGLDIYTDQATLLHTDRTAGFSRFIVPANGKVGIHVLGGLAPTPNAPTEWKHVDFKYITVKAARIVITPDPGATDVSQPITLTAKNLDPGTPPGAIYQWDFGDGTTATVTGDSTVTRAWNTAGNYTVKVRIVNPATSQTYGRASSLVAVSTPLPVWRFTTMSSTFSGAPAADAIFLPQQYINVDIIGLMDVIRAVPRSGRLFYHANPVSIGGQAFPPGVYVMGGFQNDNDFTFNPSRPFAPLARPTVGPYPDQFGDELVIDAATQNGSLNSGTFSGTSATRIRDLTHFAQFGGGGAGVHTMTHWEVTATKTGTQLSGKITYYLEQWIIDPFACNPPASLACQTRFAGTLKWEFPFTAVRVK